MSSRPFAFVALLAVLGLGGALAIGATTGTAAPASAASKQCNNGSDDDLDGLIDYPADPGCTSRGDNSEANVSPPAQSCTPFTGISEGQTISSPLAVMLTSATSPCGATRGEFWADGTRVSDQLAFGPPYSHTYVLSPGAHQIGSCLTDSAGARTCQAGGGPHITVLAPSEPGTIRDDMRATRMTALSGHNLGELVQSPAIWNALGICNSKWINGVDVWPEVAGADTVWLEPDARWGQVYNMGTVPSSNNCWWDSARTASTSLHKNRPNGLGTWDWYADSFRLQPGYTHVAPGWVAPMQFGRGGCTGCSPTQLAIWDDSSTPDGGPYLGFYNGGGYWGATGCTGPPTTQRHYLLDLSGLTGAWIDYIIGIRWASDGSGEYYVYLRLPSRGETEFTLYVHRTGATTFAWGCGGSLGSGQSDYLSNYYGYWDGRDESLFPSNTIDYRGWVRADTYEAARGAMGSVFG